MEVKFLADVMLGRLAKWLRILGYDTHYQSDYRADYQAAVKKTALNQLIGDGRTFLSRNTQMVHNLPGAFLVSSNNVKEQLLELKRDDLILLQRSRWFTRCLLCNVRLIKGEPENARDHVPEYVFFENMDHIRYCPGCNRYFWPGTHRHRIARQLEEWGLKANPMGPEDDP